MCDMMCDMTCDMMCDMMCDMTLSYDGHDSFIWSHDSFMCST